MRRRALLSTTAALAVATSLAACGQTPQSGATSAENWPRKGKPVELVVAFAPGGAVDTAARLVAPLLEKELGTNVEVVNKPGAGGQIGYTALTSAKPDGYTIGGTGPRPSSSRPWTPPAAPSTPVPASSPSACRSSIPPSSASRPTAPSPL